MQITEEQYNCVADAIYKTLMPHLLKDLMRADVSDDEFYGGIVTAIYIFSSITGMTFEEVKNDMFLEMGLNDAF